MAGDGSEVDRGRKGGGHARKFRRELLRGGGRNGGDFRNWPNYPQWAVRRVAQHYGLVPWHPLITAAPETELYREAELIEIRERLQSRQKPPLPGGLELELVEEEGIIGGDA